MSETKICAQCGQEKPIEDFSKSYKKLCKTCVSYNEKLKRSMRISMQQPLGQPFNTSILQLDDHTPRFIPSMRVQIATACMQGLLASMRDDDNVSELAELAVYATEALINELKKYKDATDTD